jgi:hypothetical protein
MGHSLEPPRSCQARVVGHLKEARSCQVQPEGNQVRPTRLKGRRRRWRHRRRRVMLGIGRSTLLTR